MDKANLDTLEEAERIAARHLDTAARKLREAKELVKRLQNEFLKANLEYSTARAKHIVARDGGKI